MKQADQLAALAAKDEQQMEALVKENEFFILKCAAAAAHRYITKSDDEWSVALLAFSQAVKSYSPEKGGFLPFAELVIKRRVIDYLRVQSRHNSEIVVSPSVFGAEPEEQDGDAALRAEVARKVATVPGSALKEEIEAIGVVFAGYGFSFMSLTECSPKAEKTKKACAQAVRYLIDNPLLLREMRVVKQLPGKMIEKNAGVPRKILERHRKYIIAAAEIITGDYPCLAEYMRFIREEPHR